MSVETDLQQMALAQLAQRCAQETERYFHQKPHDSTVCYELFRRAFVDGNQQAWACLHDQYRPLLAGWVTEHPRFHATEEEVGYFINRALESMWRALTPEKFTRFPNLQALLAYLKSCVNTAILMALRSAETPTQTLPPLLQESKDPPVEENVLQREQQDQLWTLIDERLQDEKERIVVEAYFVLNLKPRQIYALYSDRFDRVEEIYRIKQNCLERFSRDQRIQDLRQGMLQN